MPKPETLTGVHDMGTYVYGPNHKILGLTPEYEAYRDQWLKDNQRRMFELVLSIAGNPHPVPPTPWQIAELRALHGSAYKVAGIDVIAVAEGCLW